jgi:hypothetical protein
LTRDELVTIECLFCGDRQIWPAAEWQQTGDELVIHGVLPGLRAHAADLARGDAA